VALRLALAKAVAGAASGAGATAAAAPHRSHITPNSPIPHRQRSGREARTTRINPQRRRGYDVPLPTQ
jgi:hypothetical protein